MDDISRALGMSKKTLYVKVSSKNKLVEKAVSYHQSTVESEIKQILDSHTDALESFVLLGAHLIQMIKRVEPTVIYDLKKYHRDVYNKWNARHDDFIYGCIISNMKKGVEQGYYRPELNIDVIARFYISKVHTVLDPDIFPPDKYRYEDLVKENIVYHLHGILTQEGIDKMHQNRILEKKYIK